MFHIWPRSPWPTLVWRILNMELSRRLNISKYCKFHWLLQVVDLQATVTSSYFTQYTALACKGLIALYDWVFMIWLCMCCSWWYNSCLLFQRSELQQVNNSWSWYSDFTHQSHCSQGSDTKISRNSNSMRFQQFKILFFIVFRWTTIG